ncbi:hypothetical protein BTVI_26781 [Pitangus sulphuratus]|nr:hypothetical protein BTVI_26781 [Pitangus sulphuratus]
MIRAEKLGTMRSRVLVELKKKSNEKDKTQNRPWACHDQTSTGYITLAGPHWGVGNSFLLRQAQSQTSAIQSGNMDIEICVPVLLQSGDDRDTRVEIEEKHRTLMNFARDPCSRHLSSWEQPFKVPGPKHSEVNGKSPECFADDQEKNSPSCKEHGGNSPWLEGSLLHMGMMSAAFLKTTLVPQEFVLLQFGTSANGKWILAAWKDKMSFVSTPASDTEFKF